MSLLSYTQICNLIEDGVIQKASYGNVNPASLDLTLGHIILEEKGEFPADGYRPLVVSLRDREKLHFNSINLDLTHDHKYILKPGQFILASTEEIFHLPCDIAAEYKLKSSMARMGLEHLNAGWCDPGWNGSVLTLELRNMTTYHDIELRAGDKIGQMVFFKCLPVPIEKSYAVRGSYNGDKITTASKGEVK